MPSRVSASALAAGLMFSDGEWAMKYCIGGNCRSSKSCVGRDVANLKSPNAERKEAVRRKLIVFIVSIEKFSGRRRWCRRSLYILGRNDRGASSD